MRNDPTRGYLTVKSPELLIHLQIDVVMSVEGKQHIKCTRLESEPSERYLSYSTDIDFIAHKWGIPQPGGLIPVTDQHHLLVVRLYWTPADYRQKELVKRLSLRLHKLVRDFADNDPEWQAMLAERFSGDEWKFQDFVSY